MCPNQSSINYCKRFGNFNSISKKGDGLGWTHKNKVKFRFEVVGQIWRSESRVDTSVANQTRLTKRVM